MPRHVHEQVPIGLICLLKTGKPSGSTVTFVVMHDQKEVDQLKGSVVADARARAGKAATVKYTPPDVPDDKTHYTITYKAIADGEEYKSSDEIQVWPRRAKITSRDEADKLPLKNFKFEVHHNSTKFGDGHKTSEQDPSVAEFLLDKGSAFELKGVPPYEIVGHPAPQNSKLRDLKVKVKVNFVAEFVAPVPTADPIKQWVNIDGNPAQHGKDGLGDVVEITVGVKGDRDGSGVTKADRIGRAGVMVHVNVRFSGPGNRKSRRNNPATDLLAGLNLVERVEVRKGADDAYWEFKGRVELAAADGVGKFKVCLGRAGGDTCEIKIGSTAACADAATTLRFVNWRKLWYELMAPDFMDLDTRLLADGTSVRDFAASGRANIKASGDATYIVYDLFKSHSFTEAEAIGRNKGCVLPREFFGRTSGPSKVYLLTRYSYDNNPKNFDGSKANRGILIKGCDVFMVNDGTSKHPDLDKHYTTNSAQADYDLDPYVYWSPTSANRAKAGADSIQFIRWRAKIQNPADYRRQARVKYGGNVDVPAMNRDDEDAVFVIDELHQNPASCRIVFRKPRVGHTATSLDSTAKAAIAAWLGGLWGDAQVRPHNFEMSFKVSGRAGNTRRIQRFATIRTYIRTVVSERAPQLYAHPGLNPDGTPRSGSLDWNAVVNMARSTQSKLAIDLPAANQGDPGRLAGALSDTHCPIRMHIKLESQGHINGTSRNSQVAVMWGVNCPMCVTDTFLHENGHRVGMAYPAHGIPGMPPAKTTSEVETNPAYKPNGTKGHYYTGHGHNGGHCAWGLSDSQKNGPSYGGRNNATCTIYGEGPRDDSRRTRTGFCPQCQDILRGLELR